MNASAFSTGISRLLDRGRGCGIAAASRRVQSSGRSQPQNVALPACGESAWSVNSIAIACPSVLNSNFGATGW